MRALPLLVLCLAANPPLAQRQPAQPTPRRALPAPVWLWDNDTKNDQHLFLRKVIDLPVTDDLLKDPKTKAIFWASGDNEVHVIVNGQPAGFTTEWWRPVFVDVAKHLKPGKNVIGLRTVNRESIGGVIARLMVQGADRSMHLLNTDPS